MDNEVRVVWISGNRVERRTLLDKVRAKVKADEEIRFGESSTFHDLESAVLSGDCFGSKRLLIVESLPQFTGVRQTFINHMKKLMERVPKDVFLVFSGMEAEEQKALSAHAAKVGKTFQFDKEVSKSTAISFIVKTVAESGKTISTENADAAVSRMAGKQTKDGIVYDVDYLRLTCDKLVSFADGKEIVLSEVLAAIPDNKTVLVWALYDAIDILDFQKAYDLLQPILIAEGDRLEGVRLFLHGMLWRFNLMVFLKEAMATGSSIQKAATDAATLVKMSQIGTGLESKFAADGQKYSEAMIQRVIGSYGPSVLGKYTRKRLLHIVETVENALEFSRYIGWECLEQYLLLATMVLLVSCEKINDVTRRQMFHYFEHCNEI